MNFKSWQRFLDSDIVFESLMDEAQVNITKYHFYRYSKVFSCIFMFWYNLNSTIQSSGASFTLTIAVTSEKFQNKFVNNADLTEKEKDVFKYFLHYNMLIQRKWQKVENNDLIKRNCLFTKTHNISLE